MDFIVNHSSFFLCVGVIALLAIIGYYVDKSDNEKKNASSKDVKDKEPQVNSQVSAPVEFNELPDVSEEFLTFNELPNSDKKLNDVIDEFNEYSTNDLNSNNIEDVSPVLEEIPNDVPNNIQNNVPNNIQNNVPNNIQNNIQNNVISDFGLNDFESLDLSLEDLEKKNFNELSKNISNNDDDNYFYSDMEDSTDSNLVVENPNLVPNVDNQNSVLNEEIFDNSNEQEVHAFDNETESSRVYGETEIPVANDESNEVLENSDMPVNNDLNDVSGVSDMTVNNDLNDVSGISDMPVNNDLNDVSDNNVEVPVTTDEVFNEQVISNNTNELNTNNNVSNVGPVPEIFGEIDNGNSNSNNFNDLNSNIDNQVSNEDIWKF